MKLGDKMKVKLFDADHEKDLEQDINAFVDGKNVIDIKYSVSIAVSGEDQIFCFSALIMYN